MGRAIATVEQTMAAVDPAVVPGVSMGELAEAVEHRAAGAPARAARRSRRTSSPASATASSTRDARRRETPIPEGTSVMFDFGGVVDGYCSDFGRTIYCGEPPAGATARRTT